MQQLKGQDSVAVWEPLIGSEVSVSRFLLQASRYLFWFCWACFSKVSKSSAWNLPFAGYGSYSVLESTEGQETQDRILCQFHTVVRPLLHPAEPIKWLLIHNVMFVFNWTGQWTRSSHRKFQSQKSIIKWMIPYKPMMEDKGPIYSWYTTSLMFLDVSFYFYYPHSSFYHLFCYF